MTERRVLLVTLLCLVFAAASLLLPGCAAKKAAPTEASYTLEYRLPKGTPVTYRNTQTSTQTMEMMGQSMNVTSNKALVFTLMPGDFKGNQQQMTVTIDSMEADIGTPQGPFTADAATVVGKSFEMYLSTLGKELDLSGADAIKYSIGAAGERSILPDFQGIFPDLGSAPVKVGDTWTVRDTTNIDEGGVALAITTETVDKVEGFESVGGVDCARITGTVTGQAKGAGEQQGTQVGIDSKMSGTETWLFAYKLGRLVKFNSEMSMDGAVTLGGPQGMSMPMKQQIQTEMVSVK